MVNSVDPDEILCSVAYHLGLHCLIMSNLYTSMSIPNKFFDHYSNNETRPYFGIKRLYFGILPLQL